MAEDFDPACSDPLQVMFGEENKPGDAKGRRKTRRRSNIGMKVKSKENREKEEEEQRQKQIESIYTEKNFDPPEQKEFETIFEPVNGNENEAAAEGAGRGRRGPQGGFHIGKYKSKRFLEPAKYWVEDKEKTRHRAKMSKKALKGKLKLTALTEEQEEKLKKLIEDKSDSETEAEVKETPKVNRRSDRKRGSTSAKKPHPSDKEVIPSLMTPGYATTPTLTSVATEQRTRRLNFMPGESSSFNVTSAVISQEEFQRQIEEADAFLGSLGSDDEDEEENIFMEPEVITKKKPRRDSVSVKVRRSSRFMKKTGGNDDGSGSIYQLADIQVSKLSRKQRRGIQDDDQVGKGAKRSKSFSDQDEDFKLDKDDMDVS